MSYHWNRYRCLGWPSSPRPSLQLLGYASPPSRFQQFCWDPYQQTSCSCQQHSKRWLHGRHHPQRKRKLFSQFPWRWLSTNGYSSNQGICIVPRTTNWNHHSRKVSFFLQFLFSTGHVLSQSNHLWATTYCRYVHDWCYLIFGANLSW